MSSEAHEPFDPTAPGALTLERFMELLDFTPDLDPDRVLEEISRVTQLDPRIHERIDEGDPEGRKRQLALAAILSCEMNDAIAAGRTPPQIVLDVIDDIVLIETRFATGRDADS